MNGYLLALLAFIETGTSLAMFLHDRDTSFTMITTVDASSTPGTTTTTTTAPPQTTATRQTTEYVLSDILSKVPSCARSCCLDAISTKLSLESTCGPANLLECTCSLISSSGLSLNGTVTSCIESSCTEGEVSDDEKESAQAICDVYGSSTQYSSSAIQASTHVSQPQPTSIRMTSRQLSLSNASTAFITSAKHTTTTTDSQVSPIVLSDPETSYISSPSSTAEGPQTDSGMGSKNPPTTGQIIGLSLGLSGAVIIGLLFIICGRKWRYKQFETMVLGESGHLEHGPKVREVTRLTRLEISAPLHNDISLGTGSLSKPLAHFGATEEGYAHELYLMENAPSKAFVTRAPTANANVSQSSNSKTLKSSIKSFKPRQSFAASRMSSFGRSARRQRLPSGDAGPSTRPPRPMAEKKLPPPPLALNITPPKRVYKRTNPVFITELEAKPNKSNAPPRQKPHKIYQSPVPTLDNETSISPPTITSDHKHPPANERVIPASTAPNTNAMPHPPPPVVASTLPRRMNRPKEIDRESMMTEFEEDSLVSEYGRSHDVTSPECLSSLSHSGHLASQVPTPETLTLRDFDFPFSPSKPQPNGSEKAPSQALSSHSAVQAHNPKPKSRHVPRKTHQPYPPPPVENDKIERRLRPLATTEIEARSRGRPPFRIVTNSDEVNRVFNGTGVNFQQHHSRDIHSRNDTLNLARRKRRDFVVQSKMPYAVHPDSIPAPLRVPSQARTEATNGRREISHRHKD